MNLKEEGIGIESASAHKLVSSSDRDKRKNQENRGIDP